MQATYSETSKDDLSDAKDVNTWYALEHFLKQIQQEMQEEIDR